MNIIYIAYSCNPYNGTEDKLGWYIPYYAAKQDNVVIITKEESRQSIEKFLREKNNKNIEVYYVDVPSLYKKIFSGGLYSGRLNIWNKYALLKVNEIVKEEKIDIIHQINPVEFRSIGAYGKFKDIPYVCGPVGGGEYIPKKVKKYIKNGWIFENIRYIANLYYKIKYKFNGRIKECDVLLFANSETRDYLIPKSERIKYPVMTELGSIKQREKTFQKNNLFTILSGGRLIYRKGFDLLLDAIENIPDDYKFKLKLVGNGKMFWHLKKRVENSKKLYNRVEMLGKIPHTDMGELYQSSDLFIMPSLRETTGSVILESLENGLPVVTVNRFGGKVILDEKCGILYDWDSDISPDKIVANVIIKCLDNRKMLEDMREECLKKASTFSFKEKIKIYQGIYNELLNKNR